MAKIEFTVIYEINLTDEDLAAVIKLIDEYKMGTACKLLMDNYQITLSQANCVRKTIMQGTQDFNINLNMNR